MLVDSRRKVCDDATSNSQRSYQLRIAPKRIPRRFAHCFRFNQTGVVDLFLISEKGTADEIETSMMLYMAPATVDMKKAA